MEVTIFTYPTELSLVPEIDCIKTALLYADKVRLISPNAAMQFALSQLGSMPQQDRIAIFKNLAPHLVGNSPLSDQNLIKQMRAIMTGKCSRFRYPVASAILALLEQEAQKIADFSNAVFQQAGGEHLSEAVNKGFLEISNLGVPSEECFERCLKAEAFKRNGISTENPMEQMTGEFFVELDKAIQGHNTPFFDPGVMNIVRDTLGHRESSSLDKEPHFADILFNRLPTFNAEPISKILDLRDALKDKRKRFIGALHDLGQELEPEIWQTDFENEAKKLIQAKVEPVIEEIEEELQTSDIQRFFKKLATASGSSGGVLGIALTSVSALHNLNWVSALMPAATLATLGAKAHIEAKKEKKELLEKTGKLIFYLQTRAYLSSKDP